MKILTLGNGFVADHLPYEKFSQHLPVNPDEIDYLLRNFAPTGMPDVIINCIGKTGRPNVDWCESHKEETYESNVIIPMLLADWCQRYGAHLIQLGSGCIFFGESPNSHYVQGDGSPMPSYGTHMGSYILTLPSIKIEEGWKETDFANPQSFYSKTKYSCDLMLGEMPHVTTLRLRMPVSDRDVPRNLINKLRGYKQVIDIPNSMTFMYDLVRCIEWAAETRPGGAFHVTNPQPLTAAQVMREFQKYMPEHKFEYITEQQLDNITVAKRSNCILNTDKLRLAGFQMTDSREALSRCMFDYVGNLRSKNV
jgi:dTDP-4-dehydrorhamnose reductase